MVSKEVYRLYDLFVAAKKAYSLSLDKSIIKNGFGVRYKQGIATVEVFYSYDELMGWSFSAIARNPERYGAQSGQMYAGFDTDLIFRKFELSYVGEDVILPTIEYSN